jgi:hypothetical protein
MLHSLTGSLTNSSSSLTPPKDTIPTVPVFISRERGGAAEIPVTTLPLESETVAPITSRHLPHPLPSVGVLSTPTAPPRSCTTTNHTWALGEGPSDKAWPSGLVLHAHGDTRGKGQDKGLFQGLVREERGLKTLARERRV